MAASFRAQGCPARRIDPQGEKQRPGSSGPLRLSDRLPNVFSRRVSPRRETDYDGFLHFTPTGAHCVSPRWSEAASSRNLAP
jgi:hypothetical protein